MLDPTPYLLQGEYSRPACQLFSLINALRYYGYDTPTPGTPDWEHLIEVSGCEYGEVANFRAAASALGLGVFAIPLPRGASLRAALEHVPAALTVLNPHEGVAFHNVLLIGGDVHRALLVNYHWLTGPVVEAVPWEEIDFPLTGKNFAVVPITVRPPSLRFVYQLADTLEKSVLSALPRNLRKIVRRMIRRYRGSL